MEGIVKDVFTANAQCRMKILLATSAIIPKGGGIASYNQELIKAFKAFAVFSVITDEDICEGDGIENVYSTCGHDCFSIDYCKNMVRQINDNKYDVIINSSSLLMTILAPYVNAPICSISHFVDGRLALIAGYNSQYVNRIVSLSFYGKKYLEDKFDIIDKEKVQVVYNFVHTDTLSIDKFKINRRPLNIVYPGGTSIKKSFDVVIKALRQLIKTDLEFNFYWLGGTKLPSAKLCLASNVTKLVKEDKRVKFTGFIPREKAVQIMQSTNIFLLPSRGEGCPITLLEAMQDGCIPVVSDAKHASREILEDGKFGLIVKNEDGNALFNVLCSILENPQKYTHCYEETYKYSREVLSEEKWVLTMNRVLADCTATSKQSITFEQEHFYTNIKLLQKKIKKERIRAMMASLKSSFICNWFYLTK